MVTSNGELLIVQNIERNDSLWSNIVFLERGNFSLKWKKTSSAEAFYYASESTQSNATRVFLSLFSCNFNDQLSPNFHGCVILCIFICWDTQSENSGLWQTTKSVSSAFNCSIITLAQCVVIEGFMGQSRMAEEKTWDTSVHYWWQVLKFLPIDLGKKHCLNVLKDTGHYW